MSFRDYEGAVVVPELLFPGEKVNLRKWAVVACDQYTSNSSYWNEVAHNVGNAPSALHVVLPEIYLSSNDKNTYIGNIKQTMTEYLDKGVLQLLPPGMMMVERTTAAGVRRGLVTAIDLDEYHYDIRQKPLIRATEQTVLDRIPPRVEIRRGAEIEIPHIILLMDDPRETVLGPIIRSKAALQEVYDFELMMGGGHVSGWLVSDEDMLENTLRAMNNLPTVDGMRFSVGDGNHSLASAKAIWEDAKQTMTEEEAANSPLRYALVEIVNLHDMGLTFEPIHRVLFGTNPTQCLQFVLEKLNENGAGAKLTYTRRTLAAVGDYTIYFATKVTMGKIEITHPYHPLLAGMLQPILDEYVSKNQRTSIDYIHGDAEFEQLSQEYDAVGFKLSALEKDTFFDTIVQCGVLPRKTFSLGEAEEKRFYIEGRLLVNSAPPEEPEVYDEEYEQEYDEGQGYIEGGEEDLEYTQDYDDEEYVEESYLDEEDDFIAQYHEQFEKEK